MVTELIKLKVKKEFAKGIESEVIINSFILSCEKLDASIFEPLIDEDQFEDIDKYRFLHSLKEIFDYWKGEGFTKTEMKKGTCGLCHRGEMVYEFYVNKSKIAFAYIIHQNNNELKDIFICNGSSGRISSC